MLRTLKNRAASLRRESSVCTLVLRDPSTPASFPSCRPWTPAIPLISFDPMQGRILLIEDLHESVVDPFLLCASL